MDDIATDAEILVIDGSALFRHGIVGLIQDAHPDWTCVEASNLAALRDRRGAGAAMAIVIDLHLPDLGGVEGLRDLCSSFPDHTVVVMAETDDREMILACLAAGARGYVLKSVTPALFLRALETILAGGVFAPASLTGSPVRAVPVRPHANDDLDTALAHLTERQRDVFRLLSEGCATKTIARRLDLAVGTVKVHLAAIYRVLGARSRLEAVTKAQRGYAIG